MDRQQIKASVRHGKESGLTHREIAERLGLTIGVVMGVINRAQERGEDWAYLGARGREPDSTFSDRIGLLAALSTSDCAWPIGDPGAPGFRFCGSARSDGKPYCADHCEVAFGLRVRRVPA